jgi:formate dehydrogenase major subunit
VIERHGPQAVGFLSSARLTNEENYLTQKLARTVVGTNSVHSCEST